MKISSLALLILTNGQDRLSFRLDLGPSHSPQQLDFAPEATADWTKLDVKIMRDDQ